MSLSTTKTTTFSAKCIDPDQPAQSTQSNPGRHIPFQMDRGIDRVKIHETESSEEAPT